MRKIISVAVILAMVLLSGNLSLYAAPNSPINITFNGATVEFSDVQPIIANGRVFITPSSFSQFGFHGIHTWSGTGIVHESGLRARSARMSINGDIFSAHYPTAAIFHRPSGSQFERGIVSDAPLFVQNDVVMMPVRLVLESAGFLVDWDGDTQTVVVEKQ